MCGLCGIFFESDLWNQSPEHGPSSSRRSRIIQIQYLKEILSTKNIKINDFHGTQYILEDTKGNQSLVSNLHDLWSTVESFCYKPIDPLDPEIYKVMVPLKNEKE